MEQKLLRDTFVEINLDNIKYNFIQIKKFIGDDVAMAPVVKADAYGHGAIEIASALIENGADMLAVATLTEGMELRSTLPAGRLGFDNCEILIMGYTADSYLEIAVKLMKNVLNTESYFR